MDYEALTRAGAMMGSGGMVVLDETDCMVDIARYFMAFTQVDVWRIGHFRGFYNYWEVPAGAETAVTGEWHCGPGASLFRAVTAQLGEVPIIAEDLGDFDDESRAGVDALQVVPPGPVEFAGVLWWIGAVEAAGQLNALAEAQAGIVSFQADADAAGDGRGRLRGAERAGGEEERASPGEPQ